MTPQAMARARQRFAERVAVHGRIVDPATKRRWNLIERKYELARAYLDSPPAQLAVVAAA